MEDEGGRNEREGGGAGNSQGRVNGVLQEGEQQAVDIDFLESAES